MLIWCLMVLMREEEIVQHFISPRIIWRDFAQPLKLATKAKTSLPTSNREPYPCKPIFFAVTIARFRGHCWPETAFQNVCSFGPVQAACCLADSSVAVGGVLPVVARLLMNPLNVWLLYPNWLPCMIPKCAVVSLCTFWCRCIYTHYVHHNTFLSVSVRYRPIRMIVRGVIDK